MSDPVAPSTPRIEGAAVRPRERGVVATRLRVVVVDDELALRRTIARILATSGFDVRTCDDAAEAIACVEAEPADVLVLDLGLAGGGMPLLARVRAIRPEIEVVVTVTSDEIADAVAAVRAGASDFLTKPFSAPEAVSLAVEKAAERKSLRDRARRLEESLRADDPKSEIIGTSPAMHEVRRLAESLCQSPSPVLVQGESGVGKEFVARAMHAWGPRAGRPFVPVACAAIPEGVLEGELFGWTRGAFPGATGPREGLLEAADGGTVFLDEVSGLPAAIQAKLLRVLQEGEIKRMGANDVRRIDVRLVASTTVDLKEVVQRGAFREDLYYRLGVVRLPVPPLRERREDIPLLATHFLRRYAKDLGRSATRIGPEAMSELERRPWPGNVRELESLVERAVVNAAADVVRAEDLPAPEPAAGDGVSSLPDLTLLPFRQAKAIALKAFEREYVSALLRRTNNNVTQAAKRAELDRSNFRRLVRKCER